MNEKSVIFCCVSGILCAAGVRILLSDSSTWSLAALLPMRRNAATISLTLSLFSTLCTCWVNGSILVWLWFSVQVVESFGFLCNPDCFFVAALLSVPGLRHVGAQTYAGSWVYDIMTMRA